jgi:CRP/FNR family transcriptional regulator, cyclic AMP receptor protein
VEDLASRDANLRANAVETLETMSEPEVVRPLLAVWEPQPAHRPGGAEVIRSLLTDDDPWIRACAAYAVGAFEDGELIGEVETLARDDPIEYVRESARRTVEGASSVETVSSLSIMDRVLFLGRVPLFRELSPADLKLVAELMTENAYVDGTVMAEQGDPGDEMHVVISGDVRVLMGDSAAEVARRGPGYIVGEMAIVGEQPRMASLVAVGDVRTLSIDRRRFQRILRERPDAALAVMRELVARLREAHSGQRPN